ncbi:unnamed protein product [Echinostoma caproni]|uniref:Secreted protein n=1 Tax=Echinostoma caproni TaxID=27848 RepID=A0A183APX8_9TREM|nr:unnamed protein product [Echinostoma caproni]
MLFSPVSQALSVASRGLSVGCTDSVPVFSLPLSPIVWPLQVRGQAHRLRGTEVLHLQSIGLFGVRETWLVCPTCRIIQTTNKPDGTVIQRNSCNTTTTIR